MYLLSAVQSRELDRRTIEERGIPGSRLMAQAGAAVVLALERHEPQAFTGRIGVLCGGGNNGGDGFVIARLLRQRQVQVECWIFAPSDKLRGDAAAAFQELLQTPVAAGSAPPQPVLSLEAWRAARERVLACGLLVDALFGTGLVRPVRGWIAEMMADLNHHFRGPVMAVDIPSGLGADGEGPAESAEAAVLRAKRTVTFATPKLGHYLSRHASCVGELEVANIGTPPELLPQLGACGRVSTAADCRPLLARRRRDSHKGLYGHVLFVGGSFGKSGAALLASRAALRTGAGLVTAAVPRSILPMVAAACPELMTEALPETPEGRASLSGLEAGMAEARLQELLRPASVVALGPGLSPAPESAELARRIISSAERRCVLDADGLNAFIGRRGELRFRVGGVLTPHPGEMGRLFDVSAREVQSRRLYFAQRLAAETGAVVVLKGRFSLVCDPSGRYFVNPSGNPGMATAGSGDVLTGIVAGVLAQFAKLDLLAAVAAAVFLHGRCGDCAAGRTPAGEMTLLAGDLIAALPAALERLWAECTGEEATV